MKVLRVLLVLCICWSSSSSFRIPKNFVKNRNGVDLELISLNTTYKFTSMLDEMVITVRRDGLVITDEWTGRDEQRWTLVQHPFDRNSFEFKNKVVPYNDLSGYEDLPENPGVFPRPLGLNKNRIMSNLGNKDLDENELPPVPWQILIRNRWCLWSTGRGNQIEMDDCDWENAPGQFWTLKIVEDSSSDSS